MPIRWAFAVLALSLVAAACSGSSGEGNDLDLEGLAPAEGLVNRVLRGHIEVSVAGAVETTFEGDTPLNVLTFVGGGRPRNTWQLTVGVLPENVLETGTGHVLRPAFDLVAYEGDGEYTVAAPEPGGLTEEELEQFRDDPTSVQPNSGVGVKSNAFIVIAEGDKLTNYNSLLRPCTLEIAREGNTGAIDCPAVSNGTDEISLRWSWETDPDEILRDLMEEAPSNKATTSSSSPAAPASTVTAAGGDDEPAAPVPTPADFPLDVTVDPDDCGTSGTPVTVKVRTIADATITLVMAYSDTQTHGNAILGITGADGRFNWAFIVPPTVPDGLARMLVDVSSQEQNGGDIIDAFEVKDSC